MSEEHSQQDTEKLKSAIANAILNLQSHLDSWDNLSRSQRNTLTRMKDKLVFALNDSDLLKRIEDQAAYWKRLGEE